MAADTSFPDLLKTQEFLQAVGDPATYKAAVEIIERHNLNVPNERKWTVLLFKGQFIKSVDQTTYGRMLVLVPNVPAPNAELIDKWIMYAILTPDQMPRPHVRRPVPQAKSVSLVAIHRNPKTPRHTKAYLVDFMRADVDTINITPTAYLPQVSARIAMSATKPRSSQFDLKSNMRLTAVDALSRKHPVSATPRRHLIDSFGAWPACVHPSGAQGVWSKPGPEECLNAPIEFIRTAAAELPLSPESFERIKSAMKCEECHDAFAPINYPLAVRNGQRHKGFQIRPGAVADVY